MIPATGSRSIMQERFGKVTVSFRKAPEIAGTWKQYSGQKFVGFFSGGFLPTFCAFRQEPGGKHWKKSEKFPGGILVPQNHRNYPEPAVSGPDCSTWVITTKMSGEQRVLNLSPSPPAQPARQTAAAPLLTLQLRVTGNGQVVNRRAHKISLPRSTIPATGSRGILLERCGKVIVSCQKAPEIAGTWKQFQIRKR